MSFEFTLTALQQRVLALVLAFVPLLFVAIGLVSFASAQITHHQRVSLIVRELNHYRTLQQQRASWQTKLTAVKSSPLWQNLFLPEATARPGNAPAQNPLTQIVTNAGGAVLQSSARINGASQGGATEIGERITFNADIAALTHILYELRAPQPLFVIRRLSIRDQEGPLTGPRTAPNQLTIELIATGFARPS